MKIFKFVKDEEMFLINNCNFTDEELKVFQMKQKGYSITKMSMELPASERVINSLVSDVVDKIIKTLIIRAIKNDKSSK